MSEDPKPERDVIKAYEAFTDHQVRAVNILAAHQRGAAQEDEEAQQVALDMLISDVNVLAAFLTLLELIPLAFDADPRNGSFEEFLTEYQRAAVKGLNLAVEATRAYQIDTVDELIKLERKHHE